ncbi:MAG: hypothetical protein M5U28_47340 [Sandaracinaceae bacterium]|nr:hypothetical protein [Sandaracinaceae bacterium]
MIHTAGPASPPGATAGRRDTAAGQLEPPRASASSTSPGSSASMTPAPARRRSPITAVGTTRLAGGTACSSSMAMSAS